MANNKAKAFMEAANECEREWESHNVAAYLPYYIGLATGYGPDYAYWNEMFSETGERELDASLEAEEGVLAIWFIAHMAKDKRRKRTSSRR